MKYMTFNSSCSYAGLANLLSLRGLETEDRAIALDMGLPYLFAREDGRYLAGPMLQGKRWFDLFLLPRGFIMEERTVRREDAESALTASGPAMLGLRVRPGEKHAVIYEGRRAGCLRFLNNKRRDSEEPDYLDLSPQELAERLDGSVVIGTVAPIAPEPQALREAMDPLFRPLLLDGVTMLELLGEEEVRGMLRTLQRQLLTAVREKTALRLDLALLEEAAEGYQALVSAETKNAEGS